MKFDFTLYASFKFLASNCMDKKHFFESSLGKNVKNKRKAITDKVNYCKCF